MANPQRFLKALRDATRGTYDVFRLAGPDNRKVRQSVLSALYDGSKPMPVSLCGITSIREALFQVTDPTGDCLAERERNAARNADLALGVQP